MSAPEARIASEVLIASGLVKLTLWLSPAYPTGSFAYSHGIEAAVASGEIADAAGLEAWIEDILSRGALHNDGILLVEAWRRAHRPEALPELAELGIALAASRERRLETRQQGEAFRSITLAAWPAPGMAEAFAALGEEPPYPVVFGVAARLHDLPAAPSLAAWLSAAAGNLVSAGLRLGVTGQSGAQVMLARRAARAEESAATLADSSLDDLGSCAFRADLASLRHETQGSRLFRS